MSAVTECRETLLREIRDLSDEKVKEVLDFTFFLKAKDMIDPAQSYFWTTQWQNLEKEADRDRAEENTVGNGSLDDLVNALSQ